MSYLENTRKSFIPVSHRNFRRGVTIGALSLGALFGSISPAQAGPAATHRKPSQGSAENPSFGQIVNEFLAAILPVWTEVSSFVQATGLGGTVSNSEGDSEIEIEPRNPRVPAPPPPVPVSGPESH